VARAPIGDGQSGFRALSRAAAADAEIVHDYNYAQVLTLDLLAKGYRYLEVPIGYRFRTTGRSFVRPVRYLRRVVPAVWRELNRPARGRRPARQSSTTWAGEALAGGAQAAWSKAPSGARASAAAQAMARAWWVLSWTNRPRRPKLSRAGWAAAQASRAWNGVA
jgi:hypothetical protein